MCVNGVKHQRCSSVSIARVKPNACRVLSNLTTRETLTPLVQCGLFGSFHNPPNFLFDNLPNSDMDRGIFNLRNL